MQPLSLKLLSLGLLAASTDALAAPSNVRIWATDSLMDGITNGLAPVMADFICHLPMGRILDHASVEEGPVEVVVNDLTLSNCAISGFTVHDEQDGILVKISGLAADTWGAIWAKQAGCTFMCAEPMDAKFTAYMQNSDIEIRMKLDSRFGKPVVRVQSISTNIHLQNIELQDFNGLTPFANMVTEVIEKATNTITERKLGNTVDKISALLSRLPFHGMPIGKLIGDFVPRAASLVFDADVNSIHYVKPAWVIDVLTVLASPPEVGRRAYPYAPTALPSAPPVEHRSQQLVTTASPWGINEAFFALEKLGLFMAKFDIDSHGSRVPVSISTSPSLSMHGDRAELSFESTFTGPTERTNSTIVLGADSPTLTLLSQLLKVRLDGEADVRADIEGCGSRTASIRFTPLEGSITAAASKPELAVDMRSEQAAPWWDTTCSTSGGNLLMSSLGMDNIEATVDCVRKGIKGETSTSQTLQCLLDVWASKVDLIFTYVLKADAMRSDDVPDVLSFLWEELIAVDEEIIMRSPRSATERDGDVDALHACMTARSRTTPVSVTYRCLTDAAGPAIDASYPTLMDMRSLFLTPELASYADALVAGKLPATAPDVIARINEIVAPDAKDIQEVVDEVMRIVRNLLSAMSESPGPERTDSVIASARELVPAIWSALKRVSITVDGVPIGNEFDLSKPDELEAQIKSDMVAGKSFAWSLEATDADVVGTYTRSTIGYVLHPPNVIQAELPLESAFAAAKSTMTKLAPTTRFSPSRGNSLGTLRVGYRADASGVEYIAEADWKAIVMRVLDMLNMPMLSKAVTLLPGWIDKLVAGWTRGHFWGSLNIGIDGKNILADEPIAMDEILDAKYTRTHVAADGSWVF